MVLATFYKYGYITLAMQCGCKTSIWVHLSKLFMQKQNLHTLSRIEQNINPFIKPNRTFLFLYFASLNWMMFTFLTWSAIKDSKLLQGNLWRALVKWYSDVCASYQGGLTTFFTRLVGLLGACYYVHGHRPCNCPTFTTLYSGSI